MPAIVHYEIYTHTPRGWTLHARFPGSDRDLAIEEAKMLEFHLGAPVRVIREVYYPENNISEESVTWAGRIRPGQGRRRMAAGRRAGGNDLSIAVNAPFSESDISLAYGTAAKADKATAGDAVFRIVMVMIGALGVAVAGTGLGALILEQITSKGVAVQPTTASLVLFLLFLALFLATAVPLTAAYVPLEALQGKGKPTPPRPADAPMAPEQQVSPDAEQAAERMEGPIPVPAQPEEAPDAAHKADDRANDHAGDHADTRGARQDAPSAPAEQAAAQSPAPAEQDETPEPAAPPAAQDAPATAEDRAAEAGKAETQEQDAGPATGAAPDAPDRPVLEKSRLSVMKFLSGVVSALKTVYPQLDAYNKFGVNLYLAGAAERLAHENKLTADEQARMTKEAVEVIGTKPEQAAHLVARLDSYRKEPRYRDMIVAGRVAMGLHLSGESDPFLALASVMTDWNTPRAKQLSASTVTIMFTDMVGSTSLTQAIGDAAAQDIIRAHNSIVRAALAQNRGKEVKHTGDGIMASFEDPADAVDAAIEIQSNAIEHTAKWPKLPLDLRIGLNTGDPIIEENDFFGAPVQIAARVCATADKGQVWITAATRDLLPASPRYDLFDHGGHALKGVPDEQQLFEVIWTDARRAELELLRAGAAAPDDAPEEPPAGEDTADSGAATTSEPAPPLPS